MQNCDAFQLILSKVLMEIINECRDIGNGYEQVVAGWVDIFWVYILCNVRSVECEPGTQAVCG